MTLEEQYLSARLTTLTDEATLLALKSAAARDHHRVIAPTHVVWKGNDIVGYGSVGSVPVLNVWVDSAKVNKFESVRLLKEAEEKLREAGYQFVIVPCMADSPFRKYITRLGYETLGEASYNIKKL